MGKQTGLKKPTIELDEPLARVVGGEPGELISPIELNKRVAAYIREHDLVAADGWTVRLDRPLASLVGLREGSALDRRALVSSVWSYIKAHRLQIRGGGPVNPLDEGFQRAKRELKRKGYTFSGWDVALIAGAIVLGLLIVANQLKKGPGQPPSSAAGGQGPM